MTAVFFGVRHDCNTTWFFREFVKEAGLGGKGNLPLESSPAIVKTEPWDGKDGEIIEEDEVSLEELMGEESAS